MRLGKQLYTDPFEAVLAAMPGSKSMDAHRQGFRAAVEAAAVFHGDMPDQAAKRINDRLAPPSPAACHPRGKCYSFLDGKDLTMVPTISPDEREILLAAASLFSPPTKRLFENYQPPLDASTARGNYYPRRQEIDR